MSITGTIAAIGVEFGDNSILAILCTYDGYLQHVGKTLFIYYDSYEKIRELIGLGNLLSLGQSYESRGKNKQYGTMAYHRDKDYKFKDVCPITFKCRKHFLDQSIPKYFYLFSNKNEWLMSGHEKEVEL